jgi:hypothetical protein
MRDKFVCLEGSAVGQVVLDGYAIFHAEAFIALLHTDDFDELNLMFAMNKGQRMINGYRTTLESHQRGLPKGDIVISAPFQPALEVIHGDSCSDLGIIALGGFTSLLQLCLHSPHCQLLHPSLRLDQFTRVTSWVITFDCITKLSRNERDIAKDLLWWGWSAPHPFPSSVHHKHLMYLD